MKRFICLFILSIPLYAAEYEALLDGHYAHDFNLPDDKRSFTTQPVRHAHPGINLAFVGVNLKKNSWRSRLALQAGDSVERNAAAEPGKEKYIQEAFLGYRLAADTWLDGGIYLGHIGMESWISTNNYTYTRSLLLDFVPYYAAGLRLQHKIDSASSFQFHLMQGWQNISETNQTKAYGIQYKYGPFTYNNFLGHERVVSNTDRFRHYHNFIFQKIINENVKILSSLDVGFQEQQEEGGVNAWGATALVLRQNLNATQGLGYRLEYYLDPHQSNVLTGTQHGFEVASASVNYDHKLGEHVLWRNEVRSFYAKDRIYQGHHWNGLVVSSLAIFL